MLKEVFQSSKGMRPAVPHILVLLTDGRSQDDVTPPATVAHLTGKPLEGQPSGSCAPSNQAVPPEGDRGWGKEGRK